MTQVRLDLCTPKCPCSYQLGTWDVGTSNCSKGMGKYMHIYI